MRMAAPKEQSISKQPTKLKVRQLSTTGLIDMYLWWLSVSSSWLNRISTRTRWSQWDGHIGDGVVPLDQRPTTRIGGKGRGLSIEPLITTNTQE